MDTAPTTNAEDSRVETWQEIESLVEELSELSQTPIPASRFYAALIDRAVRASAGTAGAIWAVSAEQVELQYRTGASRLPLLEDDRGSQAHKKLLLQVAEEQQGGIFPPNSSHSEQAANPTDDCAVLCPIQVEGRAVAVIEVFQAADSSPAAQRGCLDLLRVLAELSADFHRHWLLRQFRDRESTWNRFEQFVQRVHESTHVDQTAYALVNEARSFIECDRVSVALRHGRKCRLSASSGVDVIDRRSTTTRTMQAAASEIVASGQPLWYNAAEQNPESELSDVVRAYIGESNVQELAVLPLIAPASEDDSHRKRPLGAVIIEQFKQRETTLPTHRVAGVTRHGSSALSNALAIRNLPLMPLVRLLAHFKLQLRLRRLPIWVVLFSLLAAAVTALVVVPADFNIEGRGELHPVMRQNLYAPIDGDVAELPFKRQNDSDAEVFSVDQDDELVLLKNPQLEYEILRVTGELNTASSELQTLRVSMAAAGRRGTSEDRLRKQELAARHKELQAQVESLQKQLEKLGEQESLLTIKSPIDGEVLTWNVEELLRTRPVLRGQKLMEIANTHGPWILELRVPEHDIGHVIDAQDDLKQELDVRFILKTDPGIEYEGTVEEVARAIDTDPTEGATVLVKVGFDADQIPKLRPGTRVIGKIQCGRRPLGYVWLHDLWDSIRQLVTF